MLKIWAAAVDWDDWNVWDGRWDGSDIDIDCNDCFNNRDFNGKIDIKDVDWKNVDRSKINIDRDKLKNVDRSQIKNDIKDWLPPDFEETQELVWFAKHFAGEQFVIVTWPGCTEHDPRFKMFVDKLRGEVAPSAAVIAATPEAVFVAKIDDLDAKMGMVQKLLRQAGENDEFSDRHLGLNAQLLLTKPVK